MTKLRAAFLGAFWCMLFPFPCAVLLMVVWRFPIPFVGYRSGLHYAANALFAVAFYEVIGGFVVLGVLGAFAGLVSRNLRHGNEEEQKRFMRISTALIALAATTLLAVLDKIIGPW